MPKYAVHTIVLREAINKLHENPDTREIAEVMIDRRMSERLGFNAPKASAVIGCIGPDLFFWGPDYEKTANLYKFYENWIKWVVDLYNATVGKIVRSFELLGEAVEATVGEVLPGAVGMLMTLFGEIKELVNDFEGFTMTGLLRTGDEVLGLGTEVLNYFTGNSATWSHYLFDHVFATELQKGNPESKWYWFDTLHYQGTGKFAYNLVNLAETDDQLAFAYGYLTHIATDVIGHGFVNQIVGGPFRMPHIQRHGTVENFIDAWKFNERYNQNINVWLHGLLRLPPELPNNLADFLRGAFIETYQYYDHPTRLHENGFYTVEDIRKTYEIFYFVADVLGKSTVDEPKEPFTGALDILNATFERMFEEPPAPPRVSPTGCTVWDYFAFGITERSRRCYAELVESATDFFRYIADTIWWALKTAIRIIDFLLTALLTLPVMVVIAILYGVQLLLYEGILWLRESLTLQGFFYPEPRLLNSSHGRNLTTPYHCQIESFNRYPRMHSCDRNNLQCPIEELVELPLTASSWYPPSPDSTPDKFIKDEPFDEDAMRNVRRYAYVKTPKQTRDLESEEHKMGNAIDFAVWMIKNAYADPVVYTDWNLDSDRGYGYKCWKATLPSENLTDERY